MADKWLIVSFVLAILHLTVGQTHRRCPKGCHCDFENQFKRVRCEIPDSSYNINFDDLDRDIQFLEVLPKQRGKPDSFGPSLPDAFQNFRNLTRLIIRDNGIQRIPRNSAGQLSQLDTLDLAGSEVTSLRDLSLDSFPNLQILQVSNNRIESIDDDSLRPLKNVRSIGLDNNIISRISPNAFQSQQLLENLGLRNNRLTDLPAGLLESVLRLQSLDVNGNQLATVPRGVQRLLGLTRLNLGNNKITIIPSSVVQAWRSSEVLTNVVLHKNPLQCDSGLTELITWVKSRGGFQKVCELPPFLAPTDSKTKCPVCEGPRNIAGTALDSVDVGRLERLTSRPSAGNADDFAVFRVTDSGVNIPSNFNPRRDANTFAVTSADSGTWSKLQQFMPGAGVRCGSQSCFYFSAKGTNEWRTAGFVCQNIGLDLVEISSAAEQRELLRFLADVIQENSARNSRSRGWWTGMRYDPQSRTAVSAATGKPISFGIWARGRPDDRARDQACIELLDNGDWNDGRCVMPVENQFICESSLAVGQGLAQRASNDRSGGSVSGPKSVSGSASSKGSFSSGDSVSFTVMG